MRSISRSLSLLSLVVFAGCAVRLPRPGEIAIAVKATTRVEARVQVAPEAAVLVPVQNAPVVEFFGVPLDGAQDVVFVLDCSGSMANLAQGRLAQIHVANPSPPPPMPVPASPPPPPPPGPYEPPSAPPPPVSPPPVGTQPDSTVQAAPAAPPQLRKIDVAQSELVDALERLPAGTRMNVIFFNSELEAFAPGMVALDDAGRVNLITFVRETAPTGSTALAPAMRTAFMMNARRVVLLSDGLGNVGGNAAAVLRDAREAMRGGVRIDTIGVGNGQDGSLLSALAGESGGLYQAL